MTDDPRQSVADIVASAEIVEARPATPVEGEDWRQSLAENIGVGDYDGDELGPSDGRTGEPVDGVDPAVIEFCAGLDHSDTDNGLRLRKHFGFDIAVLKQSDAPRPAFVGWTGKYWDVDGGGPRALAIAQRLGGRIALEADHLAATPHEIAAIKDAEDAANELDRMEARRDKWDDADKKKARALEVMIDAGEDAAAALEKRQVARRKFAVSSKNKARLEAMLSCASPFIIRDPDDFNADPMVVATDSHTLVFRVIEEDDPECPDPDTVRKIKTVSVDAIEGHRREDWITQSVPVAYDPAATCPTWEAFLAEFQPISSVRKLVQVASGLGLLGLTVQKLIFHYGLGANGKSVFLETLVRVLGSLAVGLPAESITGNTERGAGQASPDLARLYGKNFARVLELPGDKPLHEELVKKLTGGEKIPVRSLFKGYFDFSPKFIAHMSGNGYPRIDGSDNGIWRRMTVVHWPVTLEEARQRNFEEVLAEFAPEHSGILNWLIEGAKAFLVEGLVIPEEVRAATQDYRDEMDDISDFVRACVEVAEKEQVTARTMYDGYVSWCLANAKRPRQEAKFGRVMKTKFHRTDSRIRTYEDCRLHDVPARPGGNEPRNPFDE